MNTDTAWLYWAEYLAIELSTEEYRDMCHLCAHGYPHYLDYSWLANFSHSTAEWWWQ